MLQRPQRALFNRVEEFLYPLRKDALSCSTDCAAHGPVTTNQQAAAASVARTRARRIVVTRLGGKMLPIRARGVVHGSPWLGARYCVFLQVCSWRASNPFLSDNMRVFPLRSVILLFFHTAAALVFFVLATESAPLLASSIAAITPTGCLLPTRRAQLRRP